MRRLGLMIVLLVAASAAMAENEFGDCAAARAAHPDFFRPGVVTIAALNGEDWYVYCGDAEKCFKEESDSELYEEAAVQAKMNLFNYFAKDNPGVRVEVSFARKMYQYPDGAFRCVVMGAKRSDVKVTSGGDMSKSTNGDAGKDVPLCVDAPRAKMESVKKGTSVEERENATDGQKIPDAMTLDEKIVILLSRIEKNPEDFHTHIRLARLFVKQGKQDRALRHYGQAAAIMLPNATALLPDDVDDLLESAKYEESHGELARALKHYRAVLRTGGNPDAVRYANGRVSTLLLRL